MTDVHAILPAVEIGRVAVKFEIYGDAGKVGTLTVSKKWATFRKGNCTNIKRILLEKLPEVFDKFGK